MVARWKTTKQAEAEHTGTAGCRLQTVSLLFGFTVTTHVDTNAGHIGCELTKISHDAAQCWPSWQSVCSAVHSLHAKSSQLLHASR